jgi:putative membrane protein
MDWIIIILFNALAVWLGARILEGVTVTDFTRAIIVAIVVAVLNAILGSILNFFLAPLNWLTLGLFTWVIDGMVLLVAAHFLKGLTIKNIWWAIGLALLVGVSNTVAHIFT